MKRENDKLFYVYILSKKTFFLYKTLKHEIVYKYKGAEYFAPKEVNLSEDFKANQCKVFPFKHFTV